MLPQSGPSSSSLDSGSHSNSRSSSEEDFELDSRAIEPIDPFKMNHDHYPDSPFLEEESRRALLGGERGERHRDHKNTWSQIFDLVLQTAPSLLLTTVGLLATGELLEHVSHWKAMKRVDELIIVIPVILNLKGNLEMNLSSRLGTSANTGELDDWGTARKIITGNLALLQVQATIVSFIAACVSFILGLILPRPQGPSTADDSLEAARQAIGVLLRSHGHRPKLPPADGRPKSGLIEFVMVASTSMTSACLSSLLLGAFMCGLVIVCRRHKVNPDNVAPPIASCLGDLVTLCLLAVVSAGLIDYVNTVLPLVFIILCLVTCGICVYLTRRNEFVSDLITKGWGPLIGAMIISSATGTVLDLFVSQYDGFAVLAILSSGLPGAAGSIFVSRLSTEMHAGSHDLPNTASHHHPHPSLEKTTPGARTVLLTLMAVSIPISMIFITILHILGWFTLPFVFIAFFTPFFALAVYFSLIIARSLTHFLWSKELDPDLYAMPIHSSSVDFLGQLLLVLCYESVSILGVKTHL